MFDVAVIGLGAMGSAAAHAASARGARVLGLERFTPGHTLGSSGGRSRIIRLAYFEHPDYVPLLRRAWELWRALENERGEPLLHATGGIYCGPPGSEIVAGAIRSAAAHGLPHERLDARAVRARAPALRVGDAWSGVWEPQAGWLEPERAIVAHLELARARGADLRFDEPARSWRDAADGTQIETARGTYRARTMVLTAGPWLAALLPRVAPLLRVERVPLHWFEPREAIGPLPIWIMDTVEPGGAWYGFPPDEHGLKVAWHGTATPADPDTLDRAPRASDEERVRAFMREHLPAGDGPLRAAHACMYTVTPDGHFVIDRAGEHVVYASACSGHGFKFATVVGEALADLALDGTTRLPIGFLSASRFR